MNNADGIEFNDKAGGRIEFSMCIDGVLVTIEDFGAHVDRATYFSLSKENLEEIIPKLKALLQQLDGGEDE